jgi:broad specificity phosphatase PhoE
MSLQKKKRIVLVRHGETDYNLSHRVQGNGIDVDLNPTGKQQAILLGKRLNHYIKDYGKPFDCVRSSTLIRAFNTAKIILEELNSKLEIVTTKAFIEVLSLSLWFI